MSAWASGESVRKAENGSAGQGPVWACLEHGEGVLSDEVLLRICRVSDDDPHITPEWLSRLRCVPGLVGQRWERRAQQLEAALALLAAALGQLDQYRPTCGYSGPQIQSRGWIERETLERIGKQIVGLMWSDATAPVVANAVERAVTEGVRLSFLEQREYDAWRPGMRSGSGWRCAVTATPYGVSRALALARTMVEQKPATRASQKATRTEARVQLETNSESENAADEGVQTAAASNRDKGSEKKQYRHRLLALREARGLSGADPTTGKSRDVQQVATRLADELGAWVEAISEAEADRHSSGGYWTALGDDLRDMLGPAELATGVFEDDWTPLLTHLRMSGQGDLAETLDRLAEEVIPRAQELARDLDAVAYLRSGGPRDAFYKLYAKDDLATHEGCARQGRQDVARSVMKIVGMLRTLAEGGISGTLAAAPAQRRQQPRRGRRAANIEKLEKELEKHLLAARDHAHSLLDRGRDPVLLPRPTQKELARRTGLTKSAVSRCLNDERARVLKILWETADSLEAVMNYKRRR